jgi:hypothetical protein
MGVFSSSARAHVHVVRLRLNLSVVEIVLAELGLGVALDMLAMYSGTRCTREMAKSSCMCIMGDLVKCMFLQRCVLDDSDAWFVGVFNRGSKPQTGTALEAA